MLNSKIIKRLAFLFLVTTGAGISTASALTLANSPLNKLVSDNVKPNVLFVLDDSGSMDWEFLPDQAFQFNGDYGYQSSQCNGVAYNPGLTYLAPIDPSRSVKPNISRLTDSKFDAAPDDGFSAYDGQSTSTTNLDGSVYYLYQGTVTDQDYLNTSSTFFTQCSIPVANKVTGITNIAGSSQETLFKRFRLSKTRSTTLVISGTGSGNVTSIKVNGVDIMTTSTAATGSSNSALATSIASKISLNGFTATAPSCSAFATSCSVIVNAPASAVGYAPIATGSGTTITTDVFPETDATKLQNYANWYTYYRKRILMMKSSAGEALSQLNDTGYRMGFDRINNTSSTNPIQFPIKLFSGQDRIDWYAKNLYAANPNSSTPLREALARAGKYYAKKLSNSPDPVQYSCQQNFTLLSTDGYWNQNATTQLDGKTAIGNQDGAFTNASGATEFTPRPKYDGSPADSTTSSWTLTYSKNTYYSARNFCGRRTNDIMQQPQQGTCTVSKQTDTCTPSSWSNNGTATVSQSCVSNRTPIPADTSPVLVSSKQNTLIVKADPDYSDTLADVAMYYYKTDLRDSSLSNCSGALGKDVCENNVFTAADDNKKEQHMTTFTLGLGAPGWMKFDPGYATNSNVGDFGAIKNASTASSTVCTWQTAGTTCNWPITNGGVIPDGDQYWHIDDLWHAAVNGGGTYYSATDPESLSTGISAALGGIKKRVGAAAAASSSSLSPVAGNNAAFIATYTNVIWTGNLESRPIDTTTGAISKTATWCAVNIAADTCDGAVTTVNINNSLVTYCDTKYTSGCSSGGGVRYPDALTGGFCRTEMAGECSGTLTTGRNSAVTSPLVNATGDSRSIMTAGYNSSTKKNTLVNFDGNFVKANASYFDMSKINQWSNLTSAQKTVATNYDNIAGYIRGQYGYDMDDNNVVYSGSTIVTDNRIFRKREAVLGDILESTPTFNGQSLFKYGYPGYANFKTAQNANSVVTKGNVYVGANDGMLHAFAADTGVERWAYIPSPVVPNLWKLADSIYPNSDQHKIFVNGSPAITDVCVSDCNDTNKAAWKTILVGGLGAGGRGYYALDITDPSKPSIMWEFTATGVGVGAVQDDDLGYSYAKPVISRKADNSWVVLVTSGYNNVSPGDGNGYLYVLDVASGKIISKIGTGTSSSPSGLAKIAQWNDDSNGNLGGSVYGGDLLGNLWKFDINDTKTSAKIGTGSVIKFASLYSDTGGKIPQPIMTTPVLGANGATRIIMVGTGQYLQSSDTDTSVASNTYTQSVYSLEDDGMSTYDNPRANTTLFVQQALGISSTDSSQRVLSSFKAPTAAQKGWFVDFDIKTEAGERVAVDPILDQGVLIVPTVVPTTTDCAPGGHGWVNYFDYLTGAAVTDYVSQRTDYPVVGINVYYTTGGERNINVVTSDGTQKLMGPRTAGTVGAFVGKRTLWRELTQ